MFDRNPLESLISMPGVQSAALGNGGMPYSGWRSSYSLEEILAADDHKINISLISGNCGGSVCSDRFFGLLSGKIVQLVVVVAVGM